MLFEQIFRRPGYYKTPDMEDGEAICIIKNQISGEKELHFIKFVKKEHTKPIGRNIALTEKMVNSNFRRAKSKDELFIPFSELEWE